MGRALCLWCSSKEVSCSNRSCMRYRSFSGTFWELKMSHALQHCFWTVRQRALADSWVLHNTNLLFAKTEICFFATTVTCMTQSHLLKGLTDFIDLAQQWVMHLAGKLSRCGSKCFSLISQTLRTICRPYRDFVRSQVILSIYLSPLFFFYNSILLLNASSIQYVTC